MKIDTIMYLSTLEHYKCPLATKLTYTWYDYNGNGKLRNNKIIRLNKIHLKLY